MYNQTSRGNWRRGGRLGGASGESVAYCWSDLHRGYLTKQQVKIHKCIKKKCASLEKLHCPYWERVEAEATRNRLKSAEAKRQRSEQRQRQENLLFEIRSRALEYGVYVTVIREESRVFHVCFLANGYVDLSPLGAELKQKLGKSIHWVFTRSSPEARKLLLPRENNKLTIQPRTGN